MTNRVDLQCAHCATTFAAIQRGVLVIRSRHNGERHENVITLEEVRRLLEECEPLDKHVDIV